MANGFNFGMTNPSRSTYQSPNRRLSQMLLQQQINQPRQRRRGKTGQIADLLQSGLSAYLMSKDIGQEQAAQEAFVKGAKGGDLKGAMTSLEGLSGNPYAQNRMQKLLMQQISQSQKEKQRLRDIGSEQEMYKFQQEHRAFPPIRSVPGRDVPFSPDVQSQRIERAQAAKPSWGQLPGVPGMMVSSSGQLQAVPQTPQQAAQTKLETEAAQVQAEARRGFPQVEQKAQEALANIEALTAHPGLPGVIGAPDTLAGLAYKIFDIAPAGTKEADFTARLDQIGGQQFLQAFESLKGGGAISEAEGIKASNAMSRLAKTGQSEESYRQAAEEAKTIISRGLDRYRTAAGFDPFPQMGQPPMGQPPMGQPPMGQPPMGQPPMGQPPMGQPPMGQPGSNIIQVQSIEQARQLPPGTRFFTPDGRMKIR